MSTLLTIQKTDHVPGKSEGASEDLEQPFLLVLEETLTLEEQSFSGSSEKDK